MTSTEGQFLSLTKMEGNYRQHAGCREDEAERRRDERWMDSLPCQPPTSSPSSLTPLPPWTGSRAGQADAWTPLATSCRATGSQQLQLVSKRPLLSSGRKGDHRPVVRYVLGSLTLYQRHRRTYQPFTFSPSTPIFSSFMLTELKEGRSRKRRSLGKVLKVCCLLPLSLSHFLSFVLSTTFTLV